jgi:hypothetical protein
MFKKVAKLLHRGDPGRHFDGQGLSLVIENRRNANWARRYELNHKAHELGLGSAFTFTLAEARERNRAISKQLADGIDPLALKRQQRAAQAAAVARVLSSRKRRRVTSPRISPNGAALIMDSNGSGHCGATSTP